MKERILVILSMVSWLPAPAVSQETMILNGQWEMGECRHYSQTVEVPGIKIEFGEGKGNLIASQLLTAGRLSNLSETGKPYERHYDETAVQTVLNMIEQTLK